MVKPWLYQSAALCWCLITENINSLLLSDVNQSPRDDSAPEVTTTGPSCRKNSRIFRRPDHAWGTVDGPDLRRFQGKEWTRLGEFTAETRRMVDWAMVKRISKNPTVGVPVGDGRVHHEQWVTKARNRSIIWYGSSRIKARWLLARIIPWDSNGAVWMTFAVTTSWFNNGV